MLSTGNDSRQFTPRIAGVLHSDIVHKRTRHLHAPMTVVSGSLTGHRIMLIQLFNIQFQFMINSLSASVAKKKYSETHDIALVASMEGDDETDG
jgi:hypothetical protein